LKSAILKISCIQIISELQLNNKGSNSTKMLLNLFDSLLDNLMMTFPLLDWFEKWILTADKTITIRIFEKIGFFSCFLLIFFFSLFK